MADGSVATKQPPAITQPDYIYSEQSPFERATIRLAGIEALSVLALCSMDTVAGGPTKQVWDKIWLMAGLVAQDVKRDLVEFHQSGYSGVHG